MIFNKYNMQTAIDIEVELSYSRFPKTIYVSIDIIQIVTRAESTCQTSFTHIRSIFLL